MLYQCLLSVSTLAGLFSLPVCAQQAAPRAGRGAAWCAGQTDPDVPTVDEGHTTASSPADVQFMQDMIMHHAQAVEMTALIESHTENKDLRSLGARISNSQSDEIKFMKRWLAARGEPISQAMPEMPGMDMSSHAAMTLMPGMLTQSRWRLSKKQRAKSSTICS